MAPLGDDSRRGKKLGKEIFNAAYFGNTMLVVQLLEKGGDPCYVDGRDGWTALHYASRWGKLRMMAALVAAGADIDSKCTSRETPMHQACRSDRKEACIWLLRHGANPQITNSDGCRPSEYTIEADIKKICDNFDEYSSEHANDRELAHAKGKAAKNNSYSSNLSGATARTNSSRGSSR